MSDPVVQWWRTSFGEEEIREIGDAIRAEHISQGPLTAEFEARFAAALDVPYAVATTSGSVALLMALMALGIGPGDEVIVPNRTFIATAHAALLLGSEVVLIDVRADIPVLDPARLEDAITPRTKAILPVHLNGRGADMQVVNTVAKEHGIGVIEDACQALFSKNQAGFLGTLSDIGCFSLGVTKLISTGQGGVAVTRNRETYEKLLLIRTHGVPDTFSGKFDRVGFNFKFTDLLASIGLVQLERVPQRLSHVKKVHSVYADAIVELPYLQLIPVDVGAGEVPLYVEVLCSKRDELIRFLESRHVQARPFLPDLHRSPHLNSAGEFPNSAVFSDQGLTLPCGPEQPLENVDRVVSLLPEYAYGNR